MIHLPGVWMARPATAAGRLLTGVEAGLVLSVRMSPSALRVRDEAGDARALWPSSEKAHRRTKTKPPRCLPGRLRLRVRRVAVCGSLSDAGPPGTRRPPPAR